MFLANALLGSIVSVILCGIPELIVFLLVARKFWRVVPLLWVELFLAKFVYYIILILLSEQNIDKSATLSDYGVALIAYSAVAAYFLNYGLKIQLSKMKIIIATMLFTGFVWESTRQLDKFMFGLAH